MRTRRLMVAAIVVLAIGLFFGLGLDRYLSIEFLESRHSAIDAYVTAHPVRAGAAFFLCFMAVTGLALPATAIMGIAAGATFGLAWGILLSSFASTVGASVLFLASRFVLRDWVQSRFRRQLAAINAGVEKEGAFYLFALRLVPLIPFPVLNLTMGVTPMRMRTFYWMTQLGTLAPLTAFVYAGTQLGRFEITWQLGLAFGALGLFPLAAKKALAAYRARRIYAK